MSTHNKTSRSRAMKVMVLGATILGLGVSSPWAQAGPVSHLLYVCNNRTKTIDVLDIENQHQLVRKIPMSGSSAGGITADPDKEMLWIDDQGTAEVTAYDLKTDEVIWRVDVSAAPYDCGFPDRLSNTPDGNFLYVPSKGNGKEIVMDAMTGEYVTSIPRPDAPHNNYKGEIGKYMYCGGRSHRTLYIVDPATHTTVKQVGPFSSPIRPLAADAMEKYFYVNLTDLLGFGVGDIETGEVLYEIQHVTPVERTSFASANEGTPHGNAPKSHGLAIHPNQKEVWFVDDEWGYVVVYDITVQPPVFMVNIPIFEEIDKRGFLDGHDRWMNFDIEGRYGYPADGHVIDAVNKVQTSTVIPVSEKLLEVEFQDGIPIRVGGQNGGVYNRTDTRAAGRAAKEYSPVSPTLDNHGVYIPRKPSAGSSEHVSLWNGAGVRIILEKEISGYYQARNPLPAGLYLLQVGTKSFTLVLQ